MKEKEEIEKGLELRCESIHDYALKNISKYSNTIVSIITDDGEHHLYIGKSDESKFIPIESAILLLHRIFETTVKPEKIDEAKKYLIKSIQKF